MIEIFSNTHLPIHQLYSLLIDKLEINIPVLKTDLWNELNTLWPIKADIYAEIDPVMVDAVTEQGLYAINCSITNLDLENESIQTIIDLSTIDHIADPYPALKEYFRVLKKGKQANCYIVCWMGNHPVEKMNNWDGFQYYFDEKDFVLKVLKAGFSVYRCNIFEGWGNHESYLKFFHLKKNNNFFIIPAIRRLFFSLTIFLQKFAKKSFQKDIINSKTLFDIDLSTIISSSMFNIGSSKFCIKEKGVCFNALNDDPYFILPFIGHLPKYLMLKIDMTPPEITTFQVFYKQHEKKDYCEEFSIKKHINTGRSITKFYFPMGINDRIRIDPGNCAGKYIIHSIQICRYY